MIWLDAWADGVDDVTLDKVREKHRPIRMETRGWLLWEDDIGVSLFYERVHDSQEYRGRTFIPKGMIETIDDYPVKRKRAKKDAISVSG